MKKILIPSLAAVALLSFAACNENNGENDTTMEDSTAMSGSADMSVNTVTTTESYVDLGTGSAVRKDDASGKYVDASSGNPVDFYVNVNSNDTFYGATGQNVNNALIHNSDGSWKVDDAKVKIDGDEMKYKDGDTKVKMEGDEYKSKDGDTKVKAEDGKVKVKKDN